MAKIKNIALATETLERSLNSTKTRLIWKKSDAAIKAPFS